MIQHRYTNSMHQSAVLRFCCYQVYHAHDNPVVDKSSLSRLQADTAVLFGNRQPTTHSLQPIAYFATPVIRSKFSSAPSGDFSSPSG